MQKGSGFLLVYSITSRQSFDELEKFIASLRKLHQRPIVIVGNKSDRESERQVTEKEGQSFAEKHDMFFFETSARQGENVKEAFARLLSIVVQTELKKAQNTKVVKKEEGCCDGMIVDKQ